MLFPFLRPDLPRPEEWVDYLKIAYDQRYFTNFGPLATKLADLMGSAYLASGYSGLLCSSNTAGLVATLQALGMEGCKVALPDFTFAATVQAIYAAGAVPVICDIDPVTWELAAESLEAAFAAHPDIGCVIHVRPFGLVREIESTRVICRSKGVPLIIDAAAGLGAPKDDVTFGSDFGEIEVFSLHATKVFAIGEGGLICAPHGLNQKIKAAMNFGFKADRTYGEGQNAKVDEFRAAIGLAMLEKMDHIVTVRREHAKFYMNFFDGYYQCTVAASPGQTPWSTFPVIFEKPVNAAMVGNFANNGIEIKKYYWPGVMKGYTGKRERYAVDLTVSLSLQDRCACFPVYSDFTQTTGSLLRNSLERAMSLV